MKLYKLTALMGFAMFAMVMAPGTASAQQYSCSYGTYSSGYTTTCNATGNNASTTTTSTAILKTASAQTAGLISNRIAAATTGSHQLSLAENSFAASTGVAAGNHTGGYNAWVSGSWSDVEDNNTDTAFNGDVYTMMIGADYQVDDRLLVGVGFGYESTDIDTEFNQSLTGADGNIDGDGWTIAPYMSYGVVDHVRANLVAGYSDIEYDTLRYDPLSGNSISGSTEADRFFVDASLNSDYTIQDAWHLRGKAGIFWATEDKDGYTETESNGATITQASYSADLGQFQVDARLGYLFSGIEPYALVGLEFDFTKDEATVGAGQTGASLDEEDFGARLGGGVELRLGPNVTGGVEIYTVEFRDDYEEVTATGNLRVHF